MGVTYGVQRKTPGGRDLESQPSIQENFKNLKPNLDQLWKTFRVKMLYQGPDEVKCSMRTSNDERVGQSPPAFALQKANISLSIKDFLKLGLRTNDPSALDGDIIGMPSKVVGACKAGHILLDFMSIERVPELKFLCSTSKYRRGLSAGASH